MRERRLEISPVAWSEVDELRRQLGVSAVMAQVLARRGLGDPAAARAWLEADERHHHGQFAGIDTAVATILAAARDGAQITVHGDYDADGVVSTTILVATLRDLGAIVDWHLPSRTEDGYGLSAATVERLAGRGTRLLITADCGITSVEEVALARSLGMDVVVSDHHTPRADGALPDAPLVHPAVCGYPCPDLCAGAVAYKLAGALFEAAGKDPMLADEHLDIVALATVADCVPLHGENRRLVREGLRALSRTRRPGLRALMEVARVDPARADAGTIGFRLAPRINAAGRLHRADAGIELLLTTDPERARAIALELDRANAQRRDVETRILFEAEAQVAAQGPSAAYVLAADGWHPGVVGIVASRIAERHHRPAVLIALDGDQGSGSGRSIPGFDLLSGFDAAAGHLLRHGGHRAAAGCTIARESVEAFRAAFTAHAEAVLRPEDLVAREHVDAVVAGGELGITLAEELAGLAPHGIGNPAPSLLLPAARLTDPRPMGENKHVRFTVEAGSVKARAVAFGSPRLPCPEDEPADATFRLELNEYNGAVEPRLVLRHASPSSAQAPELVGEPEPGSDAWAKGLLALRAVDPTGVSAPSAEPGLGGARDRRGMGVAGVIGALAHSGERVLVVCADAPARRRQMSGRLGGFAVVSWDALEADRSIAADTDHVVVLDPPLLASHRALLDGLDPWLAWGDPELRFARNAMDRDFALRPALTALYRALRDGATVGDALAGRPLHAAARLVCVLRELGLVRDCDSGLEIVPGARAELEQSPSFRAAAARHAEASRWLSSATARAA